VQVLKRIKNWLPESVRTVLLCIIRPMPPMHDNVAYNRKFWDISARRWDPSKVRIEDQSVQEADRDKYLEFLGDEWGRKADVEMILSDFIYPYITTETFAAEIGVGGGRIASRIAGRVKELGCYDISQEMLKRGQAALSSHSNVRFELLDGPKLPEDVTNTYDFVYSFDVFVHLDIHTIWKYFQEIARVLKPGARAFLHTTNLDAPGGWEHFASQEAYSVASHYFISPEIVQIFARRSGLTIARESTVDQENFYLNRDYLVVLEKLIS